MNEHIPAEDFAAYVDGMLRLEKKNELESHFSRCPACLDELVEIAAIMRSRDKIPAEFLKRALGEKSKTTNSVLHLRLVFEIAAALVVVVSIGYLFLSGNRFWQTPEQQKPSVVMDKNVRLADTSTHLRDEEMAPLPAARRERNDAKKTKSERAKTDAGQGLGDSSVPQKRTSTVAVAGMPAAKVGSVQTTERESKLKESAAEPEAFSDVQMDFAAKDKRTAKGKVEAVVETKQNLEKQKNQGAAAALASEPQKEKLKDEISQLRASAAVPQSAGAGQLALEDKKQDAALARKEIAGKGTAPPVRLEGDVSLSELLNPELIFAWPWFQKGLALELQIDGAGTVIAVVPLGKIDPLLARQAENEARKLLFSVSKKKSRRARLHAD